MRFVSARVSPPGVGQNHCVFTTPLSPTVKRIALQGDQRFPISPFRNREVIAAVTKHASIARIGIENRPIPGVRLRAAQLQFRSDLDFSCFRGRGFGSPLCQARGWGRNVPTSSRVHERTKGASRKARGRSRLPRIRAGLSASPSDLPSHTYPGADWSPDSRQNFTYSPHRNLQGSSFGPELWFSGGIPQFGRICAMECAMKAGLLRRFSRRVNIVASKSPSRAPRNPSVIERRLKVRRPCPVRRNPVYAIATVQKIPRTFIEPHICAVIGDIVPKISCRGKMS